MLARKRANASESQIQTVDALLDQTVAGMSTKSIDCERNFTYFNILGCGDEIWTKQKNYYLYHLQRLHIVTPRKI